MTTPAATALGQAMPSAAKNWSGRIGIRLVTG
jgi:hypothetical protein